MTFRGMAQEPQRVTLLFPAAAQSHSQHKTSAERRLRRRSAERTTSQHKDGLNDHADENVLARDRERDQHTGIQDHA